MHHRRRRRVAICIGKETLRSERIAGGVKEALKGGERL